MNNSLDRRGFLKAMLVLAGSVVAPGLISAGPRSAVYVPSMKPMISRFDPDDAKQVGLRRDERFMWEPDVENGIYRNRALSRKLRYASMHIVAADGTGDFRTLQEGVNACQPGDTVVVKTGTYDMARVATTGIRIRGVRA